VHRCKISTGGSDQHPARLRALNGVAAETLINLASARGYLQMFDETCSTLKEALDLTRCCDGEESDEVAAMAIICQEQVQAIIKQLYMHMEYMLTNSIRLYHSKKLGSWGIFGDSSVTLAQWWRARDLTNLVVRRSPVRFWPKTRQLDSHGFEQVDPQARVLNFCFQ